jgi:hypothetical protein
LLGGLDLPERHQSLGFENHDLICLSGQKSTRMIVSFATGKESL